MTVSTYFPMYLIIGLIITGVVARQRDFGDELHPLEIPFVVLLWPAISVIIIGYLIKDGLVGLFEWVRNYKDKVKQE